METLIDFVQNWGYLAVFLGALVEGESVILLASGMAKLGHLSIIKVGVIAFIGTLIADQGLYLVGWFYGDRIFARFPKLKQKASRAFELLHKNDVTFIMACRFIYGIRIISPVVIGAARVKPYRFMPLNFISALVWATVSCTGGYLFGAVMMEFFEYFFAAQKYLIAGVLGVLVLIFTGLQLKRYFKGKNEKK